MPRGKVCHTCGLAVPSSFGFDARFIPMSKYHIRCLRCNWPVAISMMSEDTICKSCKGRKGKEGKKVGKEDDE